MTNRGPTVLYQKRDTVVTTAFFESAGHRFPMTELADVRRAEPADSPRRFELWAQIQGRWLRVFSSRDEREFGQVCRALTRAREHAGLA